VRGRSAGLGRRGTAARATSARRLGASGRMPPGLHSPSAAARATASAGGRRAALTRRPRASPPRRGRAATSPQTAGRRAARSRPGPTRPARPWRRRASPRLQTPLVLPPLAELAEGEGRFGGEGFEAEPLPFGQTLQVEGEPLRLGLAGGPGRLGAPRARGVLEAGLPGAALEVDAGHQSSAPAGRSAAACARRRYSSASPGRSR
jgi:hypothetical protein